MALNYIGIALFTIGVVVGVAKLFPEIPENHPALGSIFMNIPPLCGRSCVCGYVSRVSR